MNEDAIIRNLTEDELRLMRVAVEQRKSAFYRLAPDGTILYVNDFACESLGHSFQELVGKYVWDFDPDFLSEAWASTWEGLKRHGIVHIEARHRRKGGSVHVTGNYISHNGGTNSFAFVQDIADRKRLEEALHEQEDFFRLIAENISDFIAVLDLDGRRLYNSPSYQRFFGATYDLRGTDSFADVHPDDQERVKQVFRNTVETGIGHQIEYRFVRPDGRIHHMESRGGVIRDTEGRVSRVVVVSQDITERKLAEERIQHLAHYDALTDLPNRALMIDRLQQAMAQVRREKGMLAVMFLDLDKFKPVNDTLGHDVGDLLLKGVATRLQTCVQRETDTVSRIGGDEFVILLANIREEKEAAIVAGKVLQTLNQPFSIGPHSIRISCSIGIAIYPRHGDDVKQLIKSADVAMYQAKEGGHNCYRFFNPGKGTNAGG